MALQTMGMAMPSPWMGRLLWYVYLEDGTFVNAELVRQGYAVIATFPSDVRHQELFLELEREAREAGRGLWRSLLILSQRHLTCHRQVPRPRRMCRLQPQRIFLHLLMHHSQRNRPTVTRLTRPFVFPLPHWTWIVVRFHIETLPCFHPTLTVLMGVMMGLGVKHNANYGPGRYGLDNLKHRKVWKKFLLGKKLDRFF
jgi:hypothetical protein